VGLWSGGGVDGMWVGSWAGTGRCCSEMAGKGVISAAGLVGGCGSIGSLGLYAVSGVVSWRKGRV